MKIGVNLTKRKNPLAIMWMERFAVTQRTSNEMTPGKIQEWFRLSGEWMAMPAFTFEKITPPDPSAPAAADQKQRGMIVQILDRISLSRGRRAAAEAQGAAASEQPKAPD